MSWFRRLGRNIFGPYLGRLPPETLMKYRLFASLGYLMSVGTLAGFLYFMVKDLDDKQENLIRGEPIKVDQSELAKAAREKAIQSGVVYKYVPGKGMVVEEYNANASSEGIKKEAPDTTAKAQEIESPKTQPTPDTTNPVKSG